MPGFKINNFGGNRTNANHEARFYSSFSWEIPNLFVEDNSAQDSSVGTTLETAPSTRAPLPTCSKKISRT